MWVAAVRAGEIVRFDSGGAVSRRVSVPAVWVTSLVFGGHDMQDIYVVSADNTEDPQRKGTIFRARSDIPGLRVPKARF